MSDIDIVERLRTLKYLSNYQYEVVQDAIAEIETLRAARNREKKASTKKTARSPIPTEVPNTYFRSKKAR